MLGRELIDALESEHYLNDMFADAKREILTPFVESVSERCDQLIGKLNDFELWSKRLDEE